MLKILAIAILCQLPTRLLYATDYAAVGLGELADSADLIIIAELTPSEEKLHAKVEEVLKGDLPPEFTLSDKVTSYPPTDEMLAKFAYFGGDATVKLDELTPSNRRIFFLRSDQTGRFQTFHPACILGENEKPRVLEVLAMAKDPAPFVVGKKYDGDLDLIYLLGERFYALRVIAPAIPELERYMDNHHWIPDEAPWQRTRLTLQFTYLASRQPMIQMEPLEETGVLADFIRRLDAYGTFGTLQNEAKKQLPPTFSVTVDTNGPEKVGGLFFSDAAKFLRKQLESEDANIVKAAYGALTKMMDPQAIQIAISMICDHDTKLRTQAATILGYARDPVSINSVLSAIEFLPLHVSYGSQGYNRDNDELSRALGKAVLNFNDPKAVPVLKRVIYKGYAGGWFATALARLGDESAFEPLLYHIRNPYVDHYPGDLVNLVKRSNQLVEPWMNEGFSSDREVSQRQSAQWIAWWDAHKADFRVIRTWEEADPQLNR